MAAPNICPTVAGPVEIWVGTGAAAAMEFLGYTINGAAISQTDFTTPVPGDENGGDQGPPVDYQHFGVQYRIQLELGKFQSDVLDKVEARLNPGGTAGSFVPGILMKCAGKQYRVCLKAPNFVRNFTKCNVLGDINRSPIGAQFMRASVTFISNYDSAISGHYNTDVTGIS